jgi:hypothetical protein
MRPAPVVVVLSVLGAIIAASAAYEAALAFGLTEYSVRGEPPPGDGLELAGGLQPLAVRGLTPHENATGLQRPPFGV